MFVCPLLPTSGGRKSKCEVRLLDTVFFGEDVVAGGALVGGAWLFTSKHGTVQLKAPELTTAAKVSDRFGRFATMNPLNTEKVVGKLLAVDGRCVKQLHDSELQDVLSTERPISDAVQVFLRPQGGDENAAFAVEYTAGAPSSGTTEAGTDSEGSSATIRLFPSDSQVLGPDGGAAVRGECDGCLRGMVRHLEATCAGLRVQRLRAEFMLDDNHQPWLLAVPQLLVRCFVSPTSFNARDDRSADRDSQQAGNGGLSLPRIPSRGQQQPDGFRPASEPRKPPFEGGGPPRSSGMGGGSSRGGTRGSMVGGSRGSNSMSRDGSFADQKAAMREHLRSRELLRSPQRTPLESANGQVAFDPTREGAAAAQDYDEDQRRYAASDSGAGATRSLQPSPVRSRQQQGVASLTPREATSLPDGHEDYREGQDNGEATSTTTPPKKSLERRREERRKKLEQQQETNQQGARQKEDKLRERYQSQAKPSKANAGTKASKGNAAAVDSDRLAAFASERASSDKGVNSKAAVGGTEGKRKKRGRPGNGSSAENQRQDAIALAEMNASLEGGSLQAPERGVREEEGEDGEEEEAVLLARLEKLSGEREQGALHGQAQAQALSQQEADFQRRKQQQQLGNSSDSTHQQQHLQEQQQLLLTENGGGVANMNFSSQQSLSSSSTSGRANGGNDDAQVEELRSKVATLVQELAIAEKRQGAAMAQRQAAVDQARDLTNKLARAQQNFSAVLQEKDQSFQASQLALEEKHADVLSKVLAQTAHVEGAPALAEASKETSQLMARIDALGRELAHQTREFSVEKRRLASEASQQLQEAAAETRAKLAAEAARSQEAEDTIAKLEAQVSEGAQSLRNWQAKEEEAVKRREALEVTNEELRSELRAVQQSFAATTSLDVAQGEGGVRDGAATIAALTAQSEARIRQLNNKVEFLKASLAGEQQRYAEVEEALGASRKRLQEAQAELRRRHQEAADEAQAAADAAAASVRVEVDEARQEAAQLQAKTAALQSQLSDALNDVAVAKRREEGARMESSKLTSKLNAAQGIAADSASKDDLLAEAQRREEAADAKRAAAEALLRRLDNERAYLRSQLTSEVTLKNELQETLDNATRQLGELKQTSANERDSAEAAWARERLALEARDGEMRAANMELAAESGERGRQLEAQKALFTKTRDQLRLDQASLESLRAVNRRLVDELSAAQNEAKALAEASLAAEQRASASMKELSSAVEGTAHSAGEQLASLRRDLRDSTLKAQAAQQEAMRLQQVMSQAKQANAKERAAARLHRALQRIARTGAGGALAKWRRAAQQISFEAAAAARVQAALATAGVESEAEKAAACRALADQLKEERAAMLQEYASEASEAQAKAVSEAVARSEAAAAHAASVAREKGRARVDELEKTLADRAEAAAAEMASALARKEAEGAERAAVAVREVARRALEDRQAALLEAEGRWRETLTNREAQLRMERDDSLAAAGRESDRILAEHTEALQAEKLRLQSEADDQVSEAQLDAAKARAEAAEAMEAHAAAEATCEGLRAALVRQASDHAAMLHVEREEAVREAREAWKLEQQQEKAQWEEEAVRRTEAALSACREELGDARGRAVKLEGTKWQRSLEDLERRSDAEKQAAWRRGAEERGKQAEEEASALKAAAQSALEEVKAKAKASLEAASRDAKEQARRAHGAGKESGRAEAEKEAGHRAAAQAAEHELAMERAAHAAQQAHQKALDALRQSETEKLDKLKADAAAAREAAARETERLLSRGRELEATIASGKEEASRAAAAYRKGLDEQAATWERKMARAEKEARQKALDEAEEARNIEKQAQAKALEEAVAAAEARVAAEMSDAMTQLQDESEKLIGQLEDRLSAVRQERDSTMKDLTQARNEAEEHGDTIYDLQQSLKDAQEEAEANERAAEEARARAKVEAEKTLQRAKADAQEKAAEARAAAEAREKTLNASLSEAEQLIADAEGYRSEMHDILVNHKREALLEHQTKSAQLQQQLEKTAMDRDGIEARKDQALDEIAEMERAVKGVETSLREHGQQSAVSGGRINVAYQRKKKRLDEEMEALLVGIEDKRKGVEALEHELEDCSERQRTKEDLLKALERQLVEVLVDQQKRLLRTLTEAGQEHAKYAKDKEKLKSLSS